MLKKQKQKTNVPVDDKTDQESLFPVVSDQCPAADRLSSLPSLWAQILPHATDCPPDTLHAHGAALQNKQTKKGPLDLLL